jgi:hypothetical protein
VLDVFSDSSINAPGDSRFTLDRALSSIAPRQALKSDPDLPEGAIAAQDGSRSGLEISGPLKGLSDGHP